MHEHSHAVNYADSANIPSDLAVRDSSLEYSPLYFQRGHSASGHSVGKTSLSAVRLKKRGFHSSLRLSRSCQGTGTGMLYLQL